MQPAGRPDSRISCGLSCILTSLTLSRDNTIRDNCRISHNETRSRVRARHSSDGRQRVQNGME